MQLKVQYTGDFITPFKPPPYMNSIKLEYRIFNKCQVAHLLPSPGSPHETFPSNKHCFFFSPLSCSKSTLHDNKSDRERDLESITKVISKATILRRDDSTDSIY